MPDRHGPAGSRVVKRQIEAVPVFRSVAALRPPLSGHRSPATALRSPPQLRPAYDGVSVDDLVEHLGVHRNSLYKTFGSKRGLYLAALRRSLAEDVTPLAAAAGAADSPARAVDLLVRTPPDVVGLDLLLLAALERAPVDAEVATEVDAAFTRIEAALARVHPDRAAHLTDAALGGRLRKRLPDRRPGPDRRDPLFKETTDGTNHP